GAECAVSALSHLADYHQFRKSWQPSGQKKAASVSPHPRFPAGILPAETAFSLLDSFGIPVVPTALTRNAEEAAAAAERIGFPVALKIESAQIGHKSDVGGVALGLCNSAEVRDAFRRIQKRVTANQPTAEIAGVVVQRMASEGI